MTIDDVLPKYLQGNKEAIDFVLTLHRIVETWDDLIDKDSPIKDADINRAFMRALIELPRNGFYQRNFALLNPIVEMAILDWLTANEFERTKDSEKLRTAYILRCGILGLTVMSARIIGGYEWAQTVNTEMRALGDTWDEYAESHGVL